MGSLRRGARETREGLRSLATLATACCGRLSIGRYDRDGWRRWGYPCLACACSELAIACDLRPLACCDRLLRSLASLLATLACGNGDMCKMMMEMEKETEKGEFSQRVQSYYITKPD